MKPFDEYKDKSKNLDNKDDELTKEEIWKNFADETDAENQLKGDKELNFMSHSMTEDQMGCQPIELSIFKSNKQSGDLCYSRAFEETQKARDSQAKAQFKSSTISQKAHLSSVNISSISSNNLSSDNKSLKKASKTFASKNGHSLPKIKTDHDDKDFFSPSVLKMSPSDAAEKEDNFESFDHFTNSELAEFLKSSSHGSEEPSAEKPANLDSPMISSASQSGPTGKRNRRLGKMWQKPSPIQTRNSNIINSNNVYINTSTSPLGDGQPPHSPVSTQPHQRVAPLETALRSNLFFDDPIPRNADFRAGDTKWSQSAGQMESMAGNSAMAGAAASSKAMGSGQAEMGSVYGQQGFGFGSANVPNGPFGGFSMAMGSGLSMGQKMGKSPGGNGSKASKRYGSSSPFDMMNNGEFAQRNGQCFESSPQMKNAQDADMKSGAMRNQKMKMLNSVWSLQHRNAKYPTDLMAAQLSGRPLSSPISPITPVTPHNEGAALNAKFSQAFHNGAAKEEMMASENLNRGYFVRKCADELYKIKPRYKAAIQNLLKNGVEEANTISQTVRLYSQILCNWKKQTLYVYAKMRSSLVSLQYQLESEMTRGRELFSSYQTKIKFANQRNDCLDYKLRTLQSEYKAQAFKRNDSEMRETEERMRKIINEKDREINNLRMELEHLQTAHENVSTENERIRKESFEREQKCQIELQKSIMSASNEVKSKRKNRSVNDLGQVINNVNEQIEKIKMIRNHNNILSLNDAKNTFELSSPIIKPDITKICENLKSFIQDLSVGLEDEKLIEDYLSREDKRKKAKFSKDSIEIEKILDRRVSPEGKIQFYVACPVSSQNLSPVSPDTPSVVYGESSDPSNLFERVWVDENNLVGCENLIKRFSDGQSLCS